MNVTAKFNCGNKGTVEADFALPESWLDYLVARFRRGGFSDQDFLFSASGPEDANDIRNFTILEIDPEKAFSEARRELSELRKSANRP